MTDIGLTPRIPYRRAALVITLERGAAAAAPALAVLGLFALVALADALPALGAVGHAAALAGFAAALVAASARGARRFAAPDRATVRRRIEAASGLAHRPLSAFEDRVTTADPASRGVWRTHLQRLLASTGRLRSGWPRSPLLDSDPRAFRALLALALAVAWVIAGAGAWPRIERALSPDLDGLGAAPPTLDLWVTPPAYTGLPPIVLGGAHATAAVAGEAIAVPTGSALVARVGGVSRTPRLAIDDARSPFAASGDHEYHLETVLTDGARLAVTAGRRELGAWPIEIIPDHPPVIRFARPPSATQHAALRIDYMAADDYGLVKAWVEIRRRGAPAGPLVTETLAVPAGRKSLHGGSYFDLTPHPWAGLPVDIRLVAEDGARQSGASAWTSAVLPQRRFRNEVARAVIEQRRRLVEDPARWPEVSNTLYQIARHPSTFGDDKVVFMALVQSATRLAYDAGEPDESVVKLMWDAAVHIEEGAAAQQQRDLRAAEQNLSDAIMNNADGGQIDKLADQLKSALDQYLSSMMQSGQGRPPRPPPPGAERRTVTRDELQKMIDQARALERGGQHDQAQAMLDRLRDILENLTTEPQQAQSGAAEGRQALQDLDRLARQQRQLRDRSAQQNRAQSGDGQEKPGTGSSGAGEGKEQSPTDAARQQQEVRRQLGALMGKLGQHGPAAGGLGAADKQMRDAEEALQSGAPGQAVKPQGDALQSLEDAARAIERQMQANGQSPSGGPGQSGSGRQDPLGRSYESGSGIGDDDVAIPDDNQLALARAIYDELRRRAADPARPQIEHDYLERLLKRF